MYDLFQILDFLNYDSNTKKFLSYPERLFLHRQIKGKRNGLDYMEFPPRLEEKLSQVRATMKRTKWQYQNIRYGQDRLPYRLEDKK